MSAVAPWHTLDVSEFNEWALQSFTQKVIQYALTLPRTLENNVIVLDVKGCSKMLVLLWDDYKKTYDPQWRRPVPLELT